MESTGSVVELFIYLFVYLFQVAVWTLGHLVESTGSVVELFIYFFLYLFQVAVWTLGHLVESTGSVVEPYKKYPALLEVLLNFLKTEQSPGIRREVIFVLLSDF